jgi:hypothetical protein
MPSLALPEGDAVFVPPLPDRVAGRAASGATDTPPRPAAPFSPLPAATGARALSAPRLTTLDAAFLGLLALTIALDVIAAAFALGWPSAAATNVICALYLLSMARARPEWRPLLARLFVLGLAAGVLELFTDFAGERVAHSLVYPAGEPLLWGSPYYMPLSWAIVLTQLGYLAWRLRDLAPRVPLWLVVLVTGLAGAALVPFYEEMAWYARWWRYEPVSLVAGHTPLYVLAFEGLVAAALPLLAGRMLARPVRYAVALGVLEGLWMPCAALLAWLALGR